MDGFALLGFETIVDPGAKGLEKLLAGIVASKQRTLIYLQQDLLDHDIALLDEIRNEGGSILISEIPPLHEPLNRHASIEDLISRTLGPSALENTHE